MLLGVLLLITSLFQLGEAKFKKNKDNVAVFWGQGAYQSSLGTYCQMQDTADIVIISFLNKFHADSISFDFGNACQPGGPCPQIEQDIILCQKLGIKVFLSIGGAIDQGDYMLNSDEDGTAVGQLVFDTFHPKGKAAVKPFGAAKLDGFDFDIETRIDVGVGALAAKLRSLWKGLLISATPQCPFPDAGVNELLTNKDASVDFAFVQFYNNDACAYKAKNNGFTNSWKTWSDFVASNQSGNKKMKIYLGVCTDCFDEWIVDPDELKTLTETQRKESVFGGFALWEMASGVKRVRNGLNYVAGLQYIVQNKQLPTSNTANQSKKRQVQVLEPLKNEYQKRSVQVLAP